MIVVHPYWSSKCEIWGTAEFRGRVNTEAEKSCSRWATFTRFLSPLPLSIYRRLRACEVNTGHNTHKHCASPESVSASVPMQVQRVKGCVSMSVTWITFILSGLRLKRFENKLWASVLYQNPPEIWYIQKKTRNTQQDNKRKSLCDVPRTAKKGIVLFCA